MSPRALEQSERHARSTFSGLKWFTEEEIEPLVKELDDTADKIAKLKQEA